jgi:VIT1/CCC1 family predicted Fe2+/Mn2+ transporter
MGVAGAPLQQTTILLTGLAGLLAGAISMALGEWLSVQSSREVYARQIAIEKEELETAPAEELEELALIYQAKGIPADRARELASSIIANPRTALDTLAREELGIDPQGLGGSAWVAAARRSGSLPAALWDRSSPGNRSSARVSARQALAWPPRASRSHSASWSEPDWACERRQPVTQRNVTGNSAARH